jgi:hypothetical protein
VTKTKPEPKSIPNPEPELKRASARMRDRETHKRWHVQKQFKQMKKKYKCMLKPNVSQDQALRIEVNNKP